MIISTGGKAMIVFFKMRNIITSLRRSGALYYYFYCWLLFTRRPIKNGFHSQSYDLKTIFHRKYFLFNSATPFVIMLFKESLPFSYKKILIPFSLKSGILMESFIVIFSNC